MHAIEPSLRFIAEAVDIIGLAIVLVGAVKFLIMYVVVEVRRLVGRDCVVGLLRARRVLGGYILVALEFMIVSDVVSTVSSRSLDSLASLAAIVGLRTAIGYFLERELREEQST